MSTSRPIVRSGVIAAIAASSLGLWLGAGEVPSVPATAHAAMSPTAPAALAESTRISLHLKDTLLEDAVAALGKAAGVKFSVADSVWDARGVAKSISLDVDDKPFWEVLLTLCDKSALTLAPRGMGTESAQRIPLYPATQFGGARSTILQRPHMIHGPFLVTVDTINRVRNLAADKDGRDAVNLYMTGYCQPGTRVGQMGQLIVEEAVDEAGASLLPEASRVVSTFYSDTSPGSLNISGSLQVPVNAGRKIARLKAKLPLIIISKVETLEIPDITTLAEPVHKTVGDCTFAVSPAKPGAQQDTWELEMVITRENMMGGRAPGFGVLQSSQLVDKDGNTWRGGSSSGGGSSQKMTFKLSYYLQNSSGAMSDAKSRVPAKFVMEIPTQTREVSLPVEFKDLPLP